MTCAHKQVFDGICQACGHRVGPKLPPSTLASFEGTCVGLRCNPHNVTELTVEITQHRPEDETDTDHRHHAGPMSACEVAITWEQMSRFVPGKRYRVTISEAE